MNPANPTWLVSVNSWYALALGCAMWNGLELYPGLWYAIGRPLYDMPGPACLTAQPERQGPAQAL